MDVKTVDVIVKTNLRQFFTVCTHAGNSNDVKLSETLQWNTRLRLVVPLEHSDVISMVDKSTDHSDLRYFRNKNETGAS